MQGSLRDLLFVFLGKYVGEGLLSSEQALWVAGRWTLEESVKLLFRVTEALYCEQHG